MNKQTKDHFTREEAAQKIDRSVITQDAIGHIPPFTTGIIRNIEETEPDCYILCIEWETPNNPSTVTKGQFDQIIELQAQLTFSETLQAMYISLDLKRAFSTTQLQQISSAFSNGHTVADIAQIFPKFLATDQQAAVRILPLACKLALDLSADTEQRWALIEANRLTELALSELEEMESENMQAIIKLENHGLRPNAPLRITRQALSFLLHPQGTC